MKKIMNLYKVLCALDGNIKCAYVVAVDSTEAADEALLTRERKYKLDDRITHIEKIASTDEDTECLLVIAE